MSYTIGIDIGGTRTHAVLCKFDSIIASIDTINLSDVRRGLRETIQSLLTKVGEGEVHPEEIQAVMVGTTQFVNNVLQDKGLNKVFAIRLGAPATTALTPAADWPARLKLLIGNQSAIIPGGYEFNGEAITRFDPVVVQSLGKKIVDQKIKCVAVTGVFSHINPDQELAVYNILKKINPEFRISLSHQIGSFGLIQRENATILNAAITDAFEAYRQELQSALTDAKLINATLLLSSNNGTIEVAEDILPVQTYGSGPSNSIRGASRLLKTDGKYSIVVDVGGTSSEVGINVNGFPLQAGSDIKIGDEKEGFLCNFPSPLTMSCGLGGGSIVVVGDNNQITVGPVSVGNQLQQSAKCFGGNVLTVTDIAVAKGRLIGFGNKELLKDVPKAVIDSADEIIHHKLADMINAIYMYADSVDNLCVILVGGGSTLFDIDKLRKLLDRSIANVVIPELAASANAIGAAIAMINGQYNKVYQYEDTDIVRGMPRIEAIADACKKAFENAIEKGADPVTLKEVGITEVPMNYLPGGLHYVKAEVVGNLQNAKNVKLAKPVSNQNDYTLTTISQATPVINANNNQPSSSDSESKKYFEDMAIGAGLLGSGGGGDTTIGELMINQLLETGYVPQLKKLDNLDDDNDFVVAVGAMGTPTVGMEKLFSQDEFVLAVKEYEKILGKKITAIIPAEGAGFNALLPILVGAACNKPIVDGDCMGRAFPELQMTIPYMYGKNEIPSHAVVANCKDTKFINADNITDLEKSARELVISKGGSVVITYMPMTGKQAKSWCVPGTLGFCNALGVLLRKTRIANRVTELNKMCVETAYGPIKLIGAGKIIELNRSNDGGFNRGWAIIETQDHDKIKIEFQNENLRATNYATNHVLAIVPDIITLLDVKGKAISSEALRVGLDVSSILMIGAPAILKTPTAQAVVGAEQFHLPAISHVRNTPGLTLYTQQKMEAAGIEPASANPLLTGLHV